jgi:hypothetical protein
MRRQAIKRRGACRVYWGSHGCSKQRGHIGLHFCSAGCVPCDGEHIFGEDWDRAAYIRQVAEWMEHRRRLGKGWPSHRPDDWRLPTRLVVSEERLVEEQQATPGYWMRVAVSGGSATLQPKAVEAVVFVPCPGPSCVSYLYGVAHQHIERGQQ